ncbi:MAG: 3-dehydroquinate dehydratase [Candidatus Phytoplasma sp.]|nr:3-dehydroquinate dehydratase [Phytoplasma sp.]
MKILSISGPNLNMLGKREEKHYGKMTLKQLNTLLEEQFPEIQFTFFQSNHEGLIIDKIQEYANYDAIMINPAAYTHTSIGIRDALEIASIPKVEIHLSDITKRESFRKNNYIKDVVDQSFYGEKEESYFKAVRFLLSKLKK